MAHVLPRTRSSRARGDPKANPHPPSSAKKGAARCCGHPFWLCNRSLECKDGSERRTPIDRRAVGQTGDLGGANTSVIRKSVASVVAFFKAELDPGVHLVVNGCGVDRALDWPGAGLRANALGELEVIGISRIDTVFVVGLPARIPALRVGIEPARQWETSLDEAAVTPHWLLWGNHSLSGGVGSKDYGGRAIHREAVRLGGQPRRLVVVGQELVSEEESHVSSHVTASHDRYPAGGE